MTPAAARRLDRWLPLWWRALRTVATPRASMVLALGIAIGYAGTDEFRALLVRRT